MAAILSSSDVPRVLPLALLFGVVFSRGRRQRTHDGYFQKDLPRFGALLRVSNRVCDQFQTIGDVLNPLESIKTSSFLDPVSHCLF